MKTLRWQRNRLACLSGALALSVFTGVPGTASAIQTAQTNPSANSNAEDVAPPPEKPNRPEVRFSPAVSDVLKLIDAKVDPGIIQAYIKSSLASYNLSAGEIIALKDRGVPSNVITTMLQRTAELRSQAAQRGMPPPPAQPSAPGETAPYAPAPSVQPGYGYVQPGYGYDYGALAPDYALPPVYSTYDYGYSYPYSYTYPYNYSYWSYNYPWWPFYGSYWGGYGGYYGHRGFYGYGDFRYGRHHDFYGRYPYNNRFAYGTRPYGYGRGPNFGPRYTYGQRFAYQGRPSPYAPAGSFGPRAPFYGSRFAGRGFQPHSFASRPAFGAGPAFGSRPAFGGRSTGFAAGGGFRGGGFRGGGGRGR